MGHHTLPNRTLMFDPLPLPFRCHAPLSRRRPLGMMLIQVQVRKVQVPMDFLDVLIPHPGVREPVPFSRAAAPLARAGVVASARLVHVMGLLLVQTKRLHCGKGLGCSLAAGNLATEFFEVEAGVLTAKKSVSLPRPSL